MIDLIEARLDELFPEGLDLLQRAEFVVSLLAGDMMVVKDGSPKQVFILKKTE